MLLLEFKMKKAALTAALGVLIAKNKNTKCIIL